jgi:phytanoyl-CoA hydroxylase
MKGMSESQVEHYHEHGWVILRKLLSDDELEKIHGMTRRIESDVQDVDGDINQEGVHYNFERMNGTELKSISGPGEVRKGVLRKIQEPYLAESEFREVCASEKILDCTEDLIGETIYYHSSKLMFKPGGGGRQKPWHQDFAYWPDMKGKQVTVWFAIDPATQENGCIQVWDKSHKKGLVEHHGGELQISEEMVPKEEIVFAEMEPGDVLFFDVLTFHSSAPNFSENSRLCCIMDFQELFQFNNPHSKIEEPLRAPLEMVEA